LSRVRVGVAVQSGNSPETLINRTDIKVNLDLVVLKGDQRKSETRVGAKPELKWDIKSGLRKSVTRSTNLTRSKGVTRRLDVRERWIRDESELSSVTNHLEISTLLLGSHGELVPDVHPVTILAINALASNLNLHLGNKLLSRVIEPTGINTGVLSSGVVSKSHELVNLRESHLEICAVSEITISGDHALDTTTEIGLSVESLLNRLNCEVSVATISYFPKSNLRVTCEVHILRCSLIFLLGAEYTL
jgi:hypothetical protein